MNDQRDKKGQKLTKSEGRSSEDASGIMFWSLPCLGSFGQRSLRTTAGGRPTPCGVGVVLSHAQQTKQVGLLGLGFAGVDCCAVVADELQAEFIYEHVKGAKAVAVTRVGSVGIHNYVGVVSGPDEELHKELARPAVVASCLVQACDLVFPVHSSHVPETRGKVRVPAGRTFMQICVKRSQ